MALETAEINYPYRPSASLRRRPSYVRRDGAIYLKASLDPAEKAIDVIKECPLSLKKKQRWRLLEEPELCQELFQDLETEEDQNATILVQHTLRAPEADRDIRHCKTQILLGKMEGPKTFCDDSDDERLAVLSKMEKKVFNMNGNSLLVSQHKKVTQNGGALRVAIIQEADTEARVPERQLLKRTNMFCKGRRGVNMVNKPKWNQVHQCKRKEVDGDYEDIDMEEEEEEEEDCNELETGTNHASFRRSPSIQYSTPTIRNREPQHSSSSSRKRFPNNFNDDDFEEPEPVTATDDDVEWSKSVDKESFHLEEIPVRVSLGESTTAQLRNVLQECYGEDNIFVTGVENEAASLLTIDLTGHVQTLMSGEEDDHTASRYAVVLVLKRISQMMSSSFVVSLNILWRASSGHQKPSEASKIMLQWQEAVLGAYFSSVQELVEETVWRVLSVAKWIDFESAQASINIQTAHPCDVQSLYSSWVVSKPLTGIQMSTIAFPSNSPQSSTDSNPGTFECPVCLDSTADGVFYGASCGHCFCSSCTFTHVVSQLYQTPMRVDIPCMDAKCSMNCLPPAYLAAWVPLHLLWQRLLRPRWNLLKQSSNYRVQTCSFCNRDVQLQSCNTDTRRTVDVDCACGQSFCSLCHDIAHWPMPCDLVGSYVDHLLFYSDISVVLPVHSSRQFMSRYSVRGKPCPNCRLLIVKVGGCSHMYCTACRTSFCWDCGKTKCTNCRRRPNGNEMTFMFTSRDKDGEILHNDTNKPPLYLTVVKMRRLKHIYGSAQSRTRKQARGRLSDIWQKGDKEFSSLRLDLDTVEQIVERQKQWNLLSDSILEKFAKMCHVTENLLGTAYVLDQMVQKLKATKGSNPEEIQKLVHQSQTAMESGHRMLHLVVSLCSVWSPVDDLETVMLAYENGRKSITASKAFSPNSRFIGSRKTVTIDWVENIFHEASLVVAQFVSCDKL